MEGGLGVVASKRPCFIEDDGLASLAVADMEAGFSGSCQTGHKRPTTQGLYSRPLYYARRSSSLRNLSCLVPSSSSNSPRSTRFYDASRFEDHHQPHFLEACFGCKKVLGDNKDIFMYRGDTPFCSEECRQEQIEIDEAKERNWNLSTMQALRKKEQKKSSSSSPSKPQDYPSRTGTVAAA